MKDQKIYHNNVIDIPQGCHLNDLLIVGNTLTVDHEIISLSGKVIFEEGEKVIIREVDKTPSRWSVAFNMYMPERINWIKLKDKYGLWSLSTFTETKKLNEKRKVI